MVKGMGKTEALLPAPCSDSWKKASGMCRRLLLMKRCWMWLRSATVVGPASVTEARIGRDGRLVAKSV